MNALGTYTENKSAITTGEMRVYDGKVNIEISMGKWEMWNKSIGNCIA